MIIVRIQKISASVIRFYSQHTGDQPLTEIWSISWWLIYISGLIISSFLLEKIIFAPEQQWPKLEENYLPHKCRRKDRFNRFLSKTKSSSKLKKKILKDSTESRRNDLLNLKIAFNQTRLTIDSWKFLRPKACFILLLTDKIYYYKAFNLIPKTNFSYSLTYLSYPLRIPPASFYISFNILSCYSNSPLTSYIFNLKLTWDKIKAAWSAVSSLFLVLVTNCSIICWLHLNSY